MFSVAFGTSFYGNIYNEYLNFKEKGWNKTENKTFKKIKEFLEKFVNIDYDRTSRSH